jgi:hypothetical protein
MKNISLLFIFLLFSSVGCKTIKPVTEKSPEKQKSPVAAVSEPPAAINFSDQSTWILGYFNLAQLTREPYSSWYIKGYDDYQLKTDVINRLLDINKDGISIKIVMGTWCPDSRREVPRFMRIIDAWHIPVANITFIGVDDAKLSPVGEYKSLNILRVPTFIIYKNNIEAGRIIENPTTSLEQDIVNILTRNE